MSLLSREKPEKVVLEEVSVRADQAVRIVEYNALVLRGGSTTDLHVELKISDLKPHDDRIRASVNIIGKKGVPKNSFSMGLIRASEVERGLQNLIRRHF